MKLLRHGPPGAERPGLLGPDGTIRDLSSHLPDLSGAALAPAALTRLAAIDPATLTVVPAGTRLGCPVANVAKFIAIGLNFADHAAESNLPIPAEPAVFSKWTSCLQGPHDPVMLPPDSTSTDWEVELGIVIGSVARHVAPADAPAHIAGYVVVNDVSERAFQLERGPTWDKGKGFDSFGPVGPWLVTCDEIPDPASLDLWLDVNGERMQTGNTRTMIFDIPAIVAYCSRLMTLLPGDIITTGTPPGVGLGMKPPRYLRAGDVMRLGITGLGEQSQRVIAFSKAKPA